MKNIIKQIREEKGLTQNEMSAICGVGRQTIFDLESGVRETINDKILAVIEDLGYDPEEVIESYHYQRQVQKEELMQGLK